MLLVTRLCRDTVAVAQLRIRLAAEKREADIREQERIRLERQLARMQSEADMDRLLAAAKQKSLEKKLKKQRKLLRQQQRG